MDLYIVSGVKGSGKSTFVDYCLRNKINPFSVENDFFYFNPHPYSLDLEWSVDPKILLKNKNIISLIYCTGLDNKASMPEKLLIHFDLFNVHKTNPALDFKSHSNPEVFNDLAFVKEYFNQKPSNINSILNSAERVFAITVKIDDDLNRKFYIERSEKISRILSHSENYAFKEKLGGNIIENFYQGWFDLLGKYNHKVAEHVLIDIDLHNKKYIAKSTPHGQVKLI